MRLLIIMNEILRILTSFRINLTYSRESQYFYEHLCEYLYTCLYSSCSAEYQLFNEYTNVILGQKHSEKNESFCDLKYRVAQKKLIEKFAWSPSAFSRLCEFLLGGPSSFLSKILSFFWATLYKDLHGRKCKGTQFLFLSCSPWSGAPD